VPSTPKLAKVKITPPDPYVTGLLAKISEGKHEMRFGKGKKIFSQGDLSDGVYFIQSGKVKMSVVSSSGKEAVLVMLGPHDFFGEGALVGQSLRISTAAALEPATVFQVEKRVMLRALRDQTELSEKFMASLLKPISISKKTSAISSSTIAKSGSPGFC